MTHRRDNPITKIVRRQRHLRQIIAHSGRFYITDCRPWQIKQDCRRLDCPMRRLTLPPEADSGAYLLACNPAGDLADLLLALRQTQIIS